MSWRNIGKKGNPRRPYLLLSIEQNLGFEEIKFIEITLKTQIPAMIKVLNTLRILR